MASLNNSHCNCDAVAADIVRPRGAISCTSATYQLKRRRELDEHARQEPREKKLKCEARTTHSIAGNTKV